MSIKKIISEAIDMTIAQKWIEEELYRKTVKGEILFSFSKRYKVLN